MLSRSRLAGSRRRLLSGRCSFEVQAYRSLPPPPPASLFAVRTALPPATTICSCLGIGPCPCPCSGVCPPPPAPFADPPYDSVKCSPLPPSPCGPEEAHSTQDRSHGPQIVILVPTSEGLNPGFENKRQENPPPFGPPNWGFIIYGVGDGLVKAPCGYPKVGTGLLLSVADPPPPLG